MAAVHEEATLSPPPCWINQLPNELKLKIAQYCYDECDGKVFNYWPGRWISFGWSFDLLNRRGALVEEVNALCKYTEDFDDLVRSLPKMRNIKRFSTRSAELLLQWSWGNYGEERWEIERRNDMADALNDLIAHCKSLGLVDNVISFGEFLSFHVEPPQCFAKELRLVGGSVDLGGGFFYKTLKRFPRLKTLRISGTWILPLPELIGPPSVGLRCLDLLVKPGGASEHASTLADAFSETLTSLSLRIDGELGYGFGAVVFAPITRSYPHLERMDLEPFDRDEPARGVALLKSITAERFPQLRKLECARFKAVEKRSTRPGPFVKLLARPNFHFILRKQPPRRRR